MSQVNKKTEIAGAICAPPEAKLESTTTECQEKTQTMRQPTSLQGLLKFAMEATKTGDTNQQTDILPMDESKRVFLEHAFHSLSTGVIQILVKQIEILKKVDAIDANDSTTEFTEALNVISDYVCDIDTANDFYKIGGLAIVAPCLRCKNPEIRREVCNLLAELCQNNPLWQNVALDNDLLTNLLEVVDEDSDNSVIIKALYAINCIIRENSRGCELFIQHRGVQIFMAALKKNDEKMITKICFLMCSLCDSQSDFKSRLVFVGYISVLFELLTNTPRPCDEHLLMLLFKLIGSNSTIVSECKQNKSSEKEVLEHYLSQVRGLEEFSEQEEYARNIFNTLFAQ